MMQLQSPTFQACPLLGLGASLNGAARYAVTWWQSVVLGSIGSMPRSDLPNWRDNRGTLGKRGKAGGDKGKTGGNGGKVNRVRNRERGVERGNWGELGEGGG